jgi:integrase
MGIYKRPDALGGYWISYSVGGRRHREPGGRTRAQSEALLARRKVQAFEGRHFPKKRSTDLTMGELEALWIERSAHKKTLADERTRFKTICKHFGAGTRIAALCPRDIDKFKGVLAATISRYGTPLAPATIKRHLEILRAALRFADDNGLIATNPMKTVKMPKVHNERDRICSAEEFEALVAAAYPKLRLAIILAMYTGMRMSEITGLTWKCICLSARTVRLQHGTTKTGEGRIIPLAPEVISVLDGLPKKASGRLFDVDKRTLSPAFSRLCKKLNIEGLRFHDLRHTTATALRRAGVDLFTIAALLGHKNLATLRRYNSVTIDDLHRAIALSSTAVSPEPT